MYVTFRVVQTQKKSLKYLIVYNLYIRMKRELVENLKQRKLKTLM